MVVLYVYVLCVVCEWERTYKHLPITCTVTQHICRHHYYMLLLLTTAARPQQTPASLARSS